MSEPEPTLPATDDCGARTFTVEGRNWTARLAGQGLAGTGHLGLAPVSLVRFYPEGDEAPRYEAILPSGRFSELFEAELAALLAAARPVRD